VLKKADRRRQILDAAKQVFASRGYHATGVADIIAACDIARGTFYLHFESKRALFEILLNEFLAVIEQRVNRLDETAGVSAIRDQLRANVAAVLATFSENPEMTRLILHEAVGLDKGFDDKLAEFYDRLAGLIERALELGQTTGIVRPLDTRILAAALLGSVKELVLRIQGGRLPGSLDRVVDETMTFLVRALFVPELLVADQDGG
jgi:AcrR family transcriptional regulator